MDLKSTKAAHTAFITKEKLKGKFDLLISEHLPWDKKILQYGRDPIVFHLHKNRNFIKKLKTQFPPGDDDD